MDYIFFLPLLEQEEEMSCWEGAEGGGSKSPLLQPDGKLGLEFLCDASKLEDLPGPKFRSLRHLRQVDIYFQHPNVYDNTTKLKTHKKKC